MEQKRQAGMVEEVRTKRWTVGLIVSLIVLGGALSAGSALGKREDRWNASDAPTAESAKGHNEDHGEAAGAALAAAPGKHTAFAYDVAIQELNNGNTTAAFEIKDFSFGVENPTTIGSATGGAGAGKAQGSAFTVHKSLDKASPLLFKACVTGSHFQKVTVEVRKSGGDPAAAANGSPFARFTFGTVFVTTVDWSGGSSDGPQEQVTFVYGSLRVEYLPQDPTNSTAYGWDFIQNKAV